MKIIIQIFAFIYCLHNLSGQTLFESALSGKSNIVVKTPIEIYHLKDYNLKTRGFLNWLELKQVEFNKTDTTEIKILIEKAKTNDPIFNSWTTKELPRKILIDDNDFISFKKGLDIVPWKTNVSKKRIKKEIRKYNNRGNDRRSFPLFMSRPVYSNSGNYALIGFVKGNSGGNVSLYKKDDTQNWEFVEDIYGWSN
ncbi:MAG: hypothetical protein VXW38_04215 [Bacteroidota bacterium]|nr:hypothetical protein [Bacteroidota bacterium]